MRKALLSVAVLILATVLPAQAFAQCTNPDGVSGVMVWNADYCVTQICNGTQWIAVHPAPVNCLGGPGDNIPHVFDFTDVADATLSTQYTDSVTVEGFVVAPLTASVTGGGAEIQNVTAASPWGATADMNPGEELAIRMTSSASQGTATTATVTLGAATVDWVVTTSSAADTTPDPFDFVDVASADPSTQYDDTVAVTGFDGPLTASVSGGGAEIRNNTLAGSWGSTADLNPGNVLEIRMTSDANFASAKTADVTFGTATVDWVVTTSGDNTDPVWSTAAGTVATINTGDALSTSVTATDDSGSVSYSKQSGAGWISVNSSTGALTGTAPGSPETASITVRAEDPSGNFTDRTFDVVVQDNTDPVWSTAAGTVATINTGDALSTTVTATDDSGSVSYSKQSGAGWISVNSSTGELTGSTSTASTYSITVRAEDPSGNFADRTFNAVVNAPVGCGGQSITWGSGCSGWLSNTSHGATDGVNDFTCCSPGQCSTCNGKTGSATFLCDNGNWIYQTGSCSNCSETGCCPCGKSSCFAAGSTVLMADGTEKVIENIVIGDQLLGGDGQPTTVLAYDRPIMEVDGDNPQYLMIINGGEPFVTNDHPILTTDGWKSLRPKSAELEAIDILKDKVDLLKVGDQIIRHGEKPLLIESLEIHYHAEDMPLYNFVLSDDPVFYVNGMAFMAFVPDKAGNIGLHLQH